MFAQGLTVSGNVYDADTNSPLPGASVVVKGSNTGTTTDFDGNFTLQNLNADDLFSEVQIYFYFCSSSMLV